ncbi:hypothetical protein PPUJ20028_06280 [Pseudomonas putida]|uniref:Uncharacterized protein n=1 Tax=Pseudomonas putida TaxID=303 RepID=A0AA37VVR2_PSEPU|nr:hypothetical protein [Pseudomonas putida]GLO12047.1 hypothetical protein PPUJ20028_06280 [Pseudomonas putida]GLO35570.1 hypothetical protein PPUN14671_24030 [Pseudomonas putida]HDS0962757.1 hypothetical protein [Pseudomonas putida]HDS0989991.1 hypothetical protein [Pseudomonas putida]
MDLAKVNARFEALLNDFSSVQMHQRIASRVKDQVVLKYKSQHEALSDLSQEQQELLGKSREVFTFHNPYTGKLQPHKGASHTLAERAREAHIHHNKICQLLLVDAFEAFEDYVVDIYELAADAHSELRIREDQQRQLSKERLKKKSSDIIRNFRTMVPDLAKAEQENKMQKDLRFYLFMIEKFRHIIVHRAGRCLNPDTLIESILKNSSLLTDRARRPEAESAIRRFIGIGSVEGVIVLVEEELMGGAFRISLNRHEELLHVMSGYAMILGRSLIALDTAKNG